MLYFSLLDGHDRLKSKREVNNYGLYDLLKFQPNRPLISKSNGVVKINPTGPLPTFFRPYKMKNPKSNQPPLDLPPWDRQY
jgi:hypothetical protein